MPPVTWVVPFFPKHKNAINNRTCQNNVKHHIHLPMTVIERLKTQPRLATNDLGQKCSAGNYDLLQKPLGRPPKGQEWHHDASSGEWSLVPVVPDVPKVNDFTLVVDVVEHQIQPDDTMQGICLRYGITATQLRQANGGFSGTNLLLAPQVLRIPTTKATTTIAIDPNSKESQIRAIRRAVPALSWKEAACYWDLNDGDVAQAIASAKEDALFEAGL